MDRLTNWLNEQSSSGSLRRLVPIIRLGGGRITLVEQPEAGILWDFSSNDYLALSEHPDIVKKSRECLEKFGAGAGAARLMSGDLELNHQLEKRVAELKGQEAALVFGSGYMANTGVIPALVGRGDRIFSDRLNHASIYDGCLLSGAKLMRFHHNDLNHLEDLLRKNRGKKENCLIVAESIYSMDGDRCPLKELVYLKKRFSCLLMVDEAHATGVYGEKGGGIIEEEGVSADVDIAMGTFGKALGSYGAYVAGAKAMIQYLTNRARSFIYSTALPPAVLAASLAAINIIQTDPEIRRDLQDKVTFFKNCLLEGGLKMDLGPSQIVPIKVGESGKALHNAGELRRQGIFATAIRPPTVPRGSARLRFSITRHHNREILSKAAGLVLDILNP